MVNTHRTTNETIDKPSGFPKSIQEGITSKLVEGGWNIKNQQITAQSLLRMLRKVGISDITRKQWLAIRKVPGSQIDPNTAEVMSMYRDTLFYCNGIMGVPEREYFARPPGSDEWVRFCDLPDPTRQALCKKHRLIMPRH